MKSERIYNKKSLGLDNNIWRVMLVMIIFSLGLLSYKLAEKKKCNPFTYRIKHSSLDSVFYVGEILQFSASVNNAEVNWDFNDNSEAGEGPVVTHKYSKPGKYNVTASILDCGNSQELTVITVPAPEMKTDNISTDNKILGRSMTYEGTEEKFTCLAAANYYEWTVTNHPEKKYKVRNGPIAKFEFSSAGKYTIQVELNHDRKKRYQKEVIVSSIVKSKPQNLDIKQLLPPNIRALNEGQKPQDKKIPDVPVDHQVKLQPEKVSEKPIEKEAEATDNSSNDKSTKESSGHKFLKISDDIFKSLLERVQNGQMDLYSFDRYLCGGGTTKVMENGDKLSSFHSLWQQLNSNKKLTISSVHLNRDAQDGCVTIIKIDYKKNSSFLDKINPFKRKKSE